MTPDCVREAEVVAAVLARRLNHSIDLSAHVTACHACRETATIAQVLTDDRQASFRDVQVPAAGQVWWRAAIRARLDATHAAARPLTWAHGVAGACAAGLGAGILTMAWPTVSGFGDWLIGRAGVLGPDAIAATEVAATMLQRMVPVGVAAAFVLLAPIAIYFALSEGKRS
jgi:hypothetical protein